MPVNPRQGPAPPRTTKPVPGGKATIRSTVSLVEIDVQVTDRDGKPVKGLKQEQFSVTEDGKPQKISTFEYNDIEQSRNRRKRRTKRPSRFRSEPSLLPRKSRQWCAITG